jgi:hypothetical protein
MMNIKFLTKDLHAKLLTTPEILTLVGILKINYIVYICRLIFRILLSRKYLIIKTITKINKVWHFQKMIKMKARKIVEILLIKF